MLESRTVAPELETDVLALRPGDHLCLLYDQDPAGAMALLLPYVRQGLSEGERVVYFAGDTNPAVLRTALGEHGIDYADAETAGALVIWTGEHWYEAQPAQASEKIMHIRRAIDAALRDGFTGVRFAIDMTWTFSSDGDAAAALRDWESALHDLLASAPARMTCQYDRSKLTPSIVEAALTTHPLIVLEQQACANAFFQVDAAPGQRAASEAEAAARVDWMLGRLNAVRQFEDERRLRSDGERREEHAEAEGARVADLYEVANQTADSLAQANALKDEFLSLVSHELRTPLTVVMGNADLLLRTEKILGSQERIQALEDIRVEAHRMNRLVTNLLSVARLSIDTSEHLRPVMLTPVLRRVIAQHLRAFPSRKIKLTIRESDAPCAGIEALIEQVLVNLVSNAEKYSTSDMPIEVVVRDEDGWRVVSVKDHGIGLDPNNINRAFEAFYRSPQAAGMSSGLGIGLTVCKRLVEAQGGQIWARSREGGGAEFCFMLRRAKEEVGAAV